MLPLPLCLTLSLTHTLILLLILSYKKLYFPIPHDSGIWISCRLCVACADLSHIIHDKKNLKILLIFYLHQDVDFAQLFRVFMQLFSPCYIALWSFQDFLLYAPLQFFIMKRASVIFHDENAVARKHHRKPKNISTYDNCGIRNSKDICWRAC